MQNGRKKMSQNEYLGYNFQRIFFFRILVEENVNFEFFKLKRNNLSGMKCPLVIKN